jgi:hypothetical protein
MKKGESLFDVTMGSYDGAEVCELVGLYLLHQMREKFSSLTLDYTAMMASVCTKSYPDQKWSAQEKKSYNCSKQTTYQSRSTQTCTKSTSSTQT